MEFWWGQTSKGVHMESWEEIVSSGPDEEIRELRWGSSILCHQTISKDRPRILNVWQQGLMWAFEFIFHNSYIIILTIGLWHYDLCTHNSAQPGPHRKDPEVRFSASILIQGAKASFLWSRIKPECFLSFSKHSAHKNKYSLVKGDYLKI